MPDGPQPPYRRRRGGPVPPASERRAEVRRRRLALALALAAVGALVSVLAGMGGGRSHRSPVPAPASTPTGRPGAANHVAESSQVRALIALGKPIYCAARRGNEVALTFDDGPGVYTRLVLAKLRKHGVRATFFDVARNISLVPGATREEEAAGGVGDHTYTHPLLTALSPQDAELEIVSAQAALERSTRRPVFLFRPPYGGRSESIDAMARAHGLLEIMWTVDSADSLGANYAQIERNVIDGLHGGSIILMHENHGQTVRALLGIFAALERRHLRAVSVAQLLSDDPPSTAQVRAGGLGCGTRVAQRT
ncbi:MAG TPA: polysaccharide deacetylase family protein, partial [Solirubrobacteraceae bacterium]|nr:polysaccharide deacetylase family protein [Solirubrobacteraceae bacterium]